MRVECEIEEVEMENDQGRMTQGVLATCGRCHFRTESFGTGEGSRKRCLVLFRKDCPKEEENFYVDTAGE